MKHPLYSPDLDFWLFSTLKKAFRGRKFYSDRELLTATQTFFNHLLESQFGKTFADKCPECAQNCILSRGCYFEKTEVKC